MRKNNFTLLLCLLINGLILIPNIVVATTWNFTYSEEDWEPRDSTTTSLRHVVYPDGEYLFVDTCGSDPGIVNSNVDIDATAESKLQFRIASQCETSEDYRNKQVEVWFKNDINSSILHYAGKIYLADSQDWQEPAGLEMAGNANWAGTIVEIRVDPAYDCGSDAISICQYSADSGFVAFDYIRVVESNGSISGGVRDYFTDVALEDVAVRLEQNGQPVSGLEDWTNRYGNYEITGVPPGEYLLAALGKDGYKNKAVDGKVIKSGKSLTEQNITMEPENPILDSFQIDNGSAITHDRTVTLNNSVKYDNATEYIASESSYFYGAPELTYSASPPFTLSTGFGTKTVYLKLINGTGESVSKSDTINYYPDPSISDNKTSMNVGDEIELYCHLGTDGAYRDVTFYVDPGADGGDLDTFRETADSSGVATKVLTAGNDWVPSTSFACEDYYTREASGYDASVSVSLPNRPPDITEFIPHDASGSLVTEISHGWDVVVAIKASDPDGDAISCEYQVNENTWKPTGTADGDFTIPASYFTPGLTKEGLENFVRVKCTDPDGASDQSADVSIIDYPVPDEAPGNLSPDNTDVDAAMEYEFNFSGVDLAHHYMWYISENSDVSNAREVWTAGSPFKDSELQAGKTYYWKVCAENKLGSFVLNACSEIATFNIIEASLAPPTLLHPPVDGILAPLPNGEVGLRIEEVSGASGYRLIIDTETNIVNLPASQTVYNATLDVGVPHTWKACTLNASNECGPVSELSSFTIEDFAFGFVARTETDPDVYWIRNGIKRKFFDQPTFFDLGYSDTEIQWFEDGSLNDLTTGDTLLVDEKFCYRAQDDSTVFVIECGESHPFFHEDSFHAQGFADEEIYWAKPEGVTWIQQNYPAVDAPMIRVEPTLINIQ